MAAKHPTSRKRKPIEHAKDRTEAVSQDLHLASAELHLSNTALERHLPREARQGDVGQALVQNARTEAKVQEAAQELAHVTELLEEEAQQRERLEAELADARR